MWSPSHCCSISLDKWTSARLCHLCSPLYIQTHPWTMCNKCLCVYSLVRLSPHENSCSCFPDLKKQPLSWNMKCRLVCKQNSLLKFPWLWSHHWSDQGNQMCFASFTALTIWTASSNDFLLINGPNCSCSPVTVKQHSQEGLSWNVNCKRTTSANECVTMDTLCHHRNLACPVSFITVIFWIVSLFSSSSVAVIGTISIEEHMLSFFTAISALIHFVQKKKSYMKVYTFCI